MRINQVKKTLRDGGLSIGTMVFEFNTTGIGRLAAASGAEFVLFDMEHTGWSVETIRMLLATSVSANTVPLVRIPATDYQFVARVLDMGAMGIMVPMVQDAEQARNLVNFAKYPPVGHRGGAFGISHDNYEDGPAVDKMTSANDEILLIAQIETVSGLENVEQIAAVDGIDVLWIGQTDLSNSMGIPAQFEHPDFQAAVDRIVSVARAAGKAAGYMGMSLDECENLYQKGFRCLAYSGDLWLYQEILGESISALRQRTEA
jgi:2-dehydro-3-deoxyglucarate aldolase/4-hydroxy-2-oxoheptanedioate aldolase